MLQKELFIFHAHEKCESYFKCYEGKEDIWIFGSNFLTNYMITFDYDEEVEMAVQSLMAVMEPLIIVVMAVVVGVMLVSVLSPMMELYNSIDNA